METSPVNVSGEYSLLRLLCNISSLQDAESANACMRLLRDHSLQRQHNSQDSTMLMITVVAIVMFIVGFCFNLCVILVICRGPGFRRPVWILICNLTVADMAVLLSMIAFIIYAHKQPRLSPQVEAFLFPSIDIFVSNASMLAVASIAVNQVASLFATTWTKPCFFIASKSAAKFTVCVIWIYSTAIFVLSCLRMQYVESKSFQKFVIWLALVVSFALSVATTSVSVIVLGVFYIRNWKSCIYGHDGKLNKHDTFAGSLLPDAIAKSRSKKKATNALLTVLAPSPFVCGWSFFLAVNAYELVKGEVLTGEILNLSMLIIPWAVSACNPIVFLILTPTLRKEVFRTIKGLIAHARRKPNGDHCQHTLMTDINAN